MKLYYARGACSLSSHIALREAGATFDLVRVDTKTKLMDAGADFRTVNPNGYVPVLELDSGERLSENAAILQYIADTYPAANLAPPPGSMARYRMLEWLTFITSEVHKGYSPLFNPATPEDYKSITRERLAGRLAYVDQKLAGRQYLLGDTFSAADTYLFVCVNWSGAVNVDVSAFANLQAFQARVAARPAAQAAMQAEGLIKKA
ncbi:MAG TPA: glutathione transferase GstA [Povalibacter sp.]|uniref:glutathione transferase GstA n=1 Tax=Povalibacter sp. TaxID=1962978 RepID=UPI002D0A4DD4|nr:glutathione transferase GstA [Povalibacter sp.]HMN45774.1 glutathione transferase GstA [Povalibacter sp.]